MDSSYLKYAAAAVVVLVLVFVFLPRRSVVEVTDIEATKQQFGAPMVSATLTNVGDEIRVRYWVETDRARKQHCEGVVLLASNQSFALNFECPALKGHAGPFTLGTGPAD